VIFFELVIFKLMYKTQYLCTTIMGHKSNQPHSTKDTAGLSCN